MGPIGWAVVGVMAVGAILLPLAIRHWLAARQRSRWAKARKTFHHKREWLEAKFFDCAAASGKPRGLRWTNCDFRDEVSFVRDCETGNLTALVGVTISFEAIEGGGMEEVEAVSNLRAATAVFQFETNRWATHGRAIMNLEPIEAIEHFRGKLEPIAE